jgi:hypothetical protein
MFVEVVSLSLFVMDDDVGLLTRCCLFEKVPSPRGFEGKYLR